MRAFHHFYGYSFFKDDIMNLVSMPYAGFSSFLQRGMSIINDKRFCVNALCGLFIISTVGKSTKEKGGGKGVSMPYAGFSSFLQ